MAAMYTVGLGYYNYAAKGGLDVFVYVVAELPDPLQPEPTPPHLPPPFPPPANPATVTIDVTHPDGSHSQTTGTTQVPADSSGLARCDAAPHPVKKGAYHVEVTNVVADGYTWDQASSQTVLDFTI